MLSSTKKKFAAVVVASATILGASAAFAYWTSTGSGAGTASTGDATDFVVTTDAATGDALSPAGPTQTIGINVNNPGSGVQRLAQLVVTVANDDGSEWTDVAGCSAEDFSLGGEDAGDPLTITAGVDIAAGATNEAYSATIQMVNATGNQDGCKNIDVPLYVVAS